MRTDFTSEIDGALAGRNLGSRHFSDVARSGNGNMTDDLHEDQLADYEELDGIGETMEELTYQESAAVDGLGSLGARPKTFRMLKPGETPPFAPRPGFQWLRKRSVTNHRKPGGNRVARVKWVQMQDKRLQKMADAGQVDGLGFFGNTTTMLSIGLGAAIGVGIYLMRRKR
jgi:hypothetical protein